MKNLRVLMATLGLGLAQAAGADNLVIESFDGAGLLMFNRVNDGTYYNYRVEWAPAPSGPWSTFNGAGPWLDAISGADSGSVTSAVPMCYRVVATRGDYLTVNLSGGTNALNYPVTYYSTLADVPGGANSNAYKTTTLLMRLIPKGVYMMGSPSGELWREGDESRHQVTLTHDFYIGVFEVTQRQWELVMGNRPSYFSNVTYYAARPVEQVSTYDIRENQANNDDPAVNWPSNSTVNASSFMGKLRKKSGFASFDLPTESQWEYACRAGTATALNSGYNTSDEQMAAVGRFFYNGGRESTQDGNTSVGTATVGSYLPNAWGLYDMHGNVYEWCLDWYERAYPGAVRDPPGAASGLGRVLRGGSWYPSDYRSANREYNTQSYRYSFIGFRVARTLP